VVERERAAMSIQLRGWREYRFVTQEQLASALGVKQGKIGWLERAPPTRFPLDWLLPICRALDIGPDDFLDGRRPGAWIDEPRERVRRRAFFEMVDRDQERKRCAGGEHGR
jgi:transcriptional regulator with XRE-family HTH domain